MLRACLVMTALLALPQSPDMLNLEVRVFDGQKEVTADTRVSIYAAGDRESPISQAGLAPGRLLMRVPAGIYDAQAVLQRHGRVIAIRWAERLVVMPYPDEAGHHLQVINFASGYGALQIRPTSAIDPGDRFVLLGSAGPGQYKPVASSQHGYVLFVVPAGQYDMQVTRRSRMTWYHGIEVPLERTRFWLVP